MATQLDEYKQFIDAIAKFQACIAARWVREERAWPDLPENLKINSFLATLSGPHREVLAALLDTAYSEGIHQLLVYLNDEIALKGMRITRDGRELPVQPFGSELYYDWAARKAEDNWPAPVDENLT